MFYKQFKNFNMDKKISLYVLCSLIIRTLNIVIKGIINFTPTFNKIYLVFFLLSYFLLFVYIFYSLTLKQKKEILFFELIGFILLFLSCIRYPEFAINIFVEYSWIIITLIPSCYLVSQINNLSVLYNFLHKGSYFLTFICSFLYFFPAKKVSVDMVFSYTLLLPYLFHLAGILYNKNKFDFIFFIIETYYMITYASRGTFLCVFFYIVFYIIANLKKEKRLKIFKYFTVIFLVFLVLYLTDMLCLFNQYLIDNGIYNRTLDMLVNGNLFYNNGRFNIFTDYFNYIIRKPIFGWGIGADKVIGFYPHNIIIELFFNFGLFAFFIFGYIFFKIKQKIHNISYIEKNIILIFLSAGLIPLFFSGTYLEWINFWILLGLIFYNPNLYMNGKENENGIRSK